MGLKQKLDRLKKKYEGTKMAPAYGALHTFLYTPNDTTKTGSHIRVADDLKKNDEHGCIIISSGSYLRNF